MRQLATIQKIHSIENIEGRDRVQKAKVLEWPVIIGKDMYQEGEFVCFFEIDSILPPISQFEDMAKTKYRIKTFKVNTPDGPIYGQGYCVPLTILEGIDDFWPRVYVEGEDVTDLIGVTKYEPPANDPKFAQGDSAGTFPTHLVPKTDETRLEACVRVLEEMSRVPYVITLKYDGTSATYLNMDNKIVACSRNNMVKPPSESGKGSAYWDMVSKYPGITQLLTEYPHYAIQGEVYGEGIQKNPFGIKGKDFAAFSLYDTQQRCYLGHDKAYSMCEYYDVPFVQIIETGMEFMHSYQDICRLSEVTYQPSGKVGEGIVIRPLTEKYSKTLKGERLSFKKINPAFLVKQE